MKLKYFLLARNAAMEVDYKFRVGACLVIGKNVYVSGNMPKKTHTKASSHWKTIHAEDATIKKAIMAGEWDRIHKGILYVYRIADYGQALSKPCKDCENLIKTFKIKRTYYTTQYGFEEL